MNNLAPYQFLVALTQLASHVSHPNHEVFAILEVCNEEVPLLRDHFKKTSKKTVSQKGWSHMATNV